MKRTNLYYLAIFALTLFACGTQRKNSMRATGLEVLDSNQKALVSSSISEFNNVLERDTVSVKDTDDDSRYEVEFRVLSQQNIDDIDQPVDEKSVRNGYAKSTTEKCVVSLSERLFQAENDQILRSVILHELGHCSGLVHEDNTDKVMSVSPVPYSQYTSDAIAEFRADLKASLGL